MKIFLNCVRFCCLKMLDILKFQKWEYQCSVIVRRALAFQCAMLLLDMKTSVQFYHCDFPADHYSNQILRGKVMLSPALKKYCLENFT